MGKFSITRGVTYQGVFNIYDKFAWGKKNLGINHRDGTGYSISLHFAPFHSKKRGDEMAVNKTLVNEYFIVFFNYWLVVANVCIHTHKQVKMIHLLQSTSVSK